MIKDEMAKIHGKAGMRQAPSRNELYDAVDIITEALKSHVSRLDELEAGRGRKSKPRVRVPAGAAHDA